MQEILTFRMLVRVTCRFSFTNMKPVKAYIVFYLLLKDKHRMKKSHSHVV